jgi:hypothetical protein
MDLDREKKVSDIKEEIKLGSYTVDPKAVADAIIQRLREHVDLVPYTPQPRVSPAANTRR